MKLEFLDIAIIFGYLFLTVYIGFWLSKRASSDMKSYFLAGNNIPWYYLGLSNASGMFDVSGTMISVTWLFIYGLKSAWIPWIWPVWNQIFMMIFLAIWLRRSRVLTGAEWINFRFGKGLGGRLSHIIIVIFAVIIVIAFMAYFVEGIGKFASQFLPWDLSFTLAGTFVSSENSYALIIIGLTTIYTVKGGFYSVVGTEVMQFIIMTIACIVVGIIGMVFTTPEQIQAVIPADWDNIWFGWNLDLEWKGMFEAANNRIVDDGYTTFGFIFTLMLFKGIFASLAGPVPSYDMQRVLSTQTPKDAAKMNGLTPLVLSSPRYFMIAGITVLALVYMKPADLMNDGVLDFEEVLPFAINNYVTTGFKGLLLAGLLAAFMSTFAAFINAGSAYVVNDIYKRYVNDNASDKQYVNLGYIVTFSIVFVGLLFGFAGSNIQARTDWIVGLLYGSYVGSNMLKWIWWRFNGYGFFFGMLSGMFGVAILPKLLASDWFFGRELLAIEQFPFLFLISLLGALLGTWLTPAESDDVLIEFYRRTRPWGFWGPIKRKLLEREPDFIANKSFGRDAFNVVVGIAWQMSLVVLPIYLVLRSWTGFFITLGVTLVTSILLKYNWYDKLED